MPGSNLAQLGTARPERARANLESELLNAFGEAVIATDLDGFIIFWNRSAESLYGWTADEVYGRNILDVTPTSQSRAAAVAIFGKLANGESWAGEFETRHKDGSRLLVEVTNRPVRDQQGKLTAVVGISKPAKVSSPPKRPEVFPHEESIRSRLKSTIRDVIRDADATPLWRGFAIAFLLYGLALLLRFVIDPMMPGQAPFLTFFPAILVAAFVCGLIPTVLLAIASGITGAFVLAGVPDDATEWAYRVMLTALFLVVSAMMIAPTKYASIIHRRLKAEQNKTALLNRELKHRIKNLFAITSSICLQTIKAGGSQDAMAAAIASRIQAISSAQDLVTNPGQDGIGLQKLIEVVVKPLSPDASRIEAIGPELSLPTEAIVPFALVLHELATNAVKYGAWASEQGQVSLKWRMPDAKQLVFLWREDLITPASPREKDGFGSVIIKRALNQAQVQHVIGTHDVMCLIELPL